MLQRHGHDGRLGVRASAERQDATRGGARNALDPAVGWHTAGTVAQIKPGRSC